jgi:predicted nucleotide-binding protein
MESSMANPPGDTSQAAEDKKTRTSQSDFPIYTLAQAMRIANALWDDFAGKDAAPHQLALSLGLSPTSGGWRNLCGSALAYGLTSGGYNATSISLSDLGRRIVAPTEEGDEQAAMREACLKPRLLGEFLRRYDRAKFPKDEIARNVLVSMGLPKDRAGSALDVLKRNGDECGFVLETKTGLFVALAGSGTAPSRGNQDAGANDTSDDDGPVTDDEAEAQQPPPPVNLSPASTSPRQIFVAHGKNMKPLEELRKILDQFKIPYKIAVDEPHSGRPISAKVATLMRSCTAGIFIFTKDEQLTNAKGDEIWRPSENVVYELGAGNILWDSKIIVLKESGVNFASDYQDIGYITFDSMGLSAKALDVIKELIGLGIVQVQAV